MRRSSDKVERPPIRPQIYNNDLDEKVDEVMCGECEDDEAQTGKEGRRPKMRKPPLGVSQKERDEHNLTHTPFRSWCPFCVAGRAKQWPHLKIKDDDVKK